MKKIFIICAFFVFVFSCATMKNKNQPISPASSVAIAPFEHPISPEDVLAGYLIKDGSNINKDILKKLDKILLMTLSNSKGLHLIPPNMVLQCKEIMLLREKKVFLDPVKKWASIGKCIPADYILVPQLFLFRERVGGDWGVTEPAKVMLSLNLIDVKKGVLVKSYLYKEEQKSLTQNLLDIKKFFHRGAKWVTATELASEGIKIAVKELGL